MQIGPILKATRRDPAVQICSVVSRCRDGCCMYFQQSERRGSPRRAHCLRRRRVPKKDQVCRGSRRRSKHAPSERMGKDVVSRRFGGGSWTGRLPDCPVMSEGGLLRKIQDRRDNAVGRLSLACLGTPFCNTCMRTELPQGCGA
ncbi:uncharacterized protein LY79DRAFT_532803 [Colletotrichum navitas]|uniref:Uncharacterized protein n=1 Tax=Colletotrichum navitas TaxID=681940 RepID=A0AAD8QFH8_9PEZI|nr:uncharacterized protein LY79DRAFT_532803 [Colletotrichum navitas]KAK1600179.1 hypothetical protein LY79DRAFT_532803 [Colletotrichum navitas]